MAVLPILQYPDPFLLKKAVRVDTIDETIKELVLDMGETMFDAPGVGLAAPQVGVDKRIIVYNPNAADPSLADGLEEFKAIINPEIIASSGSIVSEQEACLSVPDYSANVKRFEKVIVKGLSIEGNPLELSFEGIMAVIMQHEIDHLDGVLYIDRISSLKRAMYKKKIAKKALA